jgi:hypothetical protein
MATTTTIDFGSDYSTFRADGTYGMTYRRISGPRVPLEGVVRRWLTNPADPTDPSTTGDAAWDPMMGIDISRFLNSAHTSRDLIIFASMMARQAELVDFVASASVRITEGTDQSLTIESQITLYDGTKHPLLVTASQAAGVVALFPTLG